MLPLLTELEHTNKPFTLFYLKKDLRGDISRMTGSFRKLKVWVRIICSSSMVITIRFSPTVWLGVVVQLIDVEDLLQQS